jgi:hypothetical protein
MTGPELSPEGYKRLADKIDSLQDMVNRGFLIPARPTGICGR